MRTFFIASLAFGISTTAKDLVERRLPSLIVPLSKYQADVPQNTQKKVYIDHNIFTEVSFDVPSNNATECKLGFYINTEPTRGAPWTIWGEAPYLFDVLRLRPIMNKDADTWNRHPEIDGWAATVEVSKSGDVNIFGGRLPCVKGEAAQFLLTPGSERDFGLNWFELKDPLHGITYEMYA
ncbi:hypothetical protein BU24DRAFT_489990 [Aaosphaeria arxii CBS 175.79]|uniref:Ubiquitin 3 binding protein But2 C-terminal domain-containing protein n=1 Tax=Aaosphaeria arxii CBS 175.79 TaxID=1450172 RepID=A0A6A5Y559_9PLEO|nr:uncharacterized protein BU24DRAFT_489990 [Aaosphaeria arxii CBS 175.79]KAF2020177.1 hypothetical protein BU24DRAFT_489990 [Aaosphaeria arxii CBS 175.79]